MQIQRIQTLYLLLSAVIMGLISFAVPVVMVADQPEMVSMFQAGLWPVVILNMIICLLSFVDMFLFNNLNLQITVANISLLLTVAVIGLEIWTLGRMEGASNTLVPVLVSCVTIVVTLLAIRGMKKDRKTLADSRSSRMWR